MRDAHEANAARPPSRLRVVGPGFYLWEADAGEALRFAADLRRRPPPPASRPRTRLVPDPLG